MKSEIVSVRMSKECKNVIDKAAAKMELSPSVYIRTAAIDYALADTEEDRPDMPETASQSKGKYNKLYIGLSPELDKKVTDAAKQIGISKQDCIRRLIREGNIYELNVNIDLDEEFQELRYQIKRLNDMISGIYTVVKKSDGVFTKREVDHMYEVMHEIRDNSYGVLSDLYLTCGQVKEMARKRMEKLIKERTSKN